MIFCLRGALLRRVGDSCSELFGTILTATRVEKRLPVTMTIVKQMMADTMDTAATPRAVALMSRRRSEA